MADSPSSSAGHRAIAGQSSVRPVGARSPMRESSAMLFRYQVRDPITGRITRAEGLADSAFALRQSLQQSGLEVLRVRERGRQDAGAGLVSRWLASWLRQRRRERLCDSFDAMATMLRAGLPLDQVLAALSQSDLRQPAERRMLLALHQAVRDGGALATAAAAHPDWFDPLDVAMVRAGQQSGDLIGVLEGLAEAGQQRAAFAHQVIMALAYPVVLLVLAIGIALFLTNGVLADLAAMVVESGKAIPLLTQIVLTAGQFLGTHGVLVALGLLLAVAAGAVLWRRLPPTSALHRWSQSIPGRRASSQARLSQVALALARLLHAGVPLTEALDTLAATLPAGRVRAALEAGGAGLRDGEDLSQVLARHRLLDREFVQLLSVGERSGELPTMLERLGDRYQRAASRGFQRLAAWLEPMAIVVLAVLIGGIALAAALLMMEIGVV